MDCAPLVGFRCRETVALGVPPRTRDCVGSRAYVCDHRNDRIDETMNAVFKNAGLANMILALRVAFEPLGLISGTTSRASISSP